MIVFLLVSLPPSSFGRRILHAGTVDAGARRILATLLLREMLSSGTVHAFDWQSLSWLLMRCSMELASEQPDRAIELGVQARRAMAISADMKRANRPGRGRVIDTTCREVRS